MEPRPHLAVVIVEGMPHHDAGSRPARTHGWNRRMFKALAEEERRSVFMATSTNKSRSSSAKNGGQDLEAEIAKLREEMAKLAEQISRTGDSSYSAARRAASEGIEQMKVQGEAAMEDLKANARDVEQQLTEAVREKPITSLAIAAGIGFLFAVLMRR
jgi:ElaB/YqjD/DUF883 family membrane-anchored ribosome-binding protein